MGKPNKVVEESNIKKITQLIEENYNFFFSASLDQDSIFKWAQEENPTFLKTLQQFGKNLAKNLQEAKDTRERMERNDPFDCFSASLRLINVDSSQFSLFLRENTNVKKFLNTNLKKILPVIKQWNQQNPDKNTHTNARDIVLNSNNTNKARDNLSYLNILKDKRMEGKSHTTLYFFKKYKKFIFNIFCSESLEKIIKNEKNPKRAQSLKQLHKEAKKFFDIYNAFYDENIKKFDTIFTNFINNANKEHEIEENKLSTKLSNALLDLILYDEDTLMIELLSSDIGIRLNNFFVQKANYASGVINQWLQTFKDKLGNDYVKYTLVQRDRIEYTVVQGSSVHNPSHSDNHNNHTIENFSSDEEASKSMQKSAYSEHKRPQQQDFADFLDFLSDATHHDKKQRTEPSSTFTSQELI